MFRYTALLICFFAASNTNAQQYFVDVDGIGGISSDDNPGTIDKPWHSAFKAFSTARPGDTVYFRQGVYRQSWTVNSRHFNQDATALSRITFSGYENEKAVITSMQPRNDTNFWVLVTGSIYSAKMTLQQDVRNVHHISQDGRPLQLMTEMNRNGGPEVLTGPGQWARDISKQKIYVWAFGGGNPGNYQTEIGEMVFGGQGAINLDNDPCDGRAANYITFDYLTFEGGFCPISVSSTGVEIKNCVIRNCSGYGIRAGQEAGAKCQNALIENCEIQGFGLKGIKVTNASGLKIRLNSIYGNFGCDANSLVEFTDSQKCVFERNTLSDAYTTGEAIAIRTNHFVNASSDIVIQNNIFNSLDCVSAVTFNGAYNCGFYNNLVNDSNLYAAITCESYVDASGTYRNVYNQVRNNIFSNNRPNSGKLYQLYTEACSADMLEMSNNCLQNMPVYAHNGIEKSLAQMQAEGFEKDSITGDPAFVNALGLDFHIAAKSLCAGAGMVISSVRDDFAGSYRSQTSFDIGPYCSASATAATLSAQSAIIFDMPATVAASEGVLCSFALRATDGQNSAISFAAQNLPSGAIVQGNVLSWMPAAGQKGVYAVVFQASNATTVSYRAVTISVLDTNRAPVLKSLGAMAVTVNSTLTFRVEATDPEGDSLRYWAENLPAGATFTANDFSWTPGRGTAGDYDVKFYVSDGQFERSQTVRITVNTTNTAPVLAGMAAKTGYENTPMSFGLFAVDADADKLTYSASGLPAGASLSGKIFMWTPGYEDSGEYKVTFTVSDGKAKMSRVATINIMNVNRVPVFTSAASRAVTEGGTISFAVEAIDADGDKLTYSATGLPAGATFSKGVFTWATSKGMAGNYKVTFKANDGMTVASQEVTINVNRLPWMRPIDKQIAYEAKAFSLTIHASDADGDKLTYSCSNLPAGAKLEGNVFTWTPTYWDGDTYEVIFYVSDGKATVSKTAEIMVNNVDRPCFFSGLTNKSGKEGSAISFTVTAIDYDKQAISYSATGLPQGAKFSGNAFTWTPNYRQAGTYNVTFTAKSGDISTSKTVTISIANVR